MSTRNVKHRQRGGNKKKLTVQQECFVMEMLADPAMNPTEAARKAKYSNPGAACQKLLKNPNVQAFLGKERLQRVERKRLEADEVMDQLREALLLDPRDIFEKAQDGSFVVKDLDEIPIEVRRCITKIKSKRRISADGEVETWMEIETMSKDAALANAMKHFNLMDPDRVNINVGGITLDFDKLCSAPQPSNVIDGYINNSKQE